MLYFRQGSRNASRHIRPPPHIASGNPLPAPAPEHLHKMNTHTAVPCPNCLNSPQPQTLFKKWCLNGLKPSALSFTSERFSHSSPSASKAAGILLRLCPAEATAQQP